MFPATPGLAAEGDILVADFNAFSGSNGGVMRVNPITGARTRVSENDAPMGAPHFFNPGDVALEADGNLLVADYDAFADMGGGLIRVDPATGMRTTLSANGAPAGGPSFSAPSGMAVAPNGNILVVDRSAFGGGGGVIRVDQTTGARTPVSENAAPAGLPNFEEPAGIALAPNGDILVADENAFGGSGGIIRVDPVTGARTTLSANGSPAGGPSFEQPVSIAIAPGGDLFVIDEDAYGGTGGVMRVDATTGARTTISANGEATGGALFRQPYGIALAPSGHILVADFDAFDDAGGLLRVDPTTGARTVLSSNGAPAGGPQFVDPIGIALMPAPRTTAPPGVTPRKPGGTLRPRRSRHQLGACAAQHLHRSPRNLLPLPAQRGRPRDVRHRAPSEGPPCREAVPEGDAGEKESPVMHPPRARRQLLAGRRGGQQRQALSRRAARPPAARGALPRHAEGERRRAERVAAGAAALSRGQSAVGRHGSGVGVGGYGSASGVGVRSASGVKGYAAWVALLRSLALWAGSPTGSPKGSGVGGASDGFGGKHPGLTRYSDAKSGWFPRSSAE